MRIAFVVGAFPLLSETFVLNQITGLLERGHEVDIYAERRGLRAHPDVERFRLLEHTRFEDMPPHPVARLLALPARLSRAGLPVGTLARACNPLRYGLEAASLRLVYQALPFTSAPRYDAIHAHFGANGCKAALLLDLGLIQGKLVTTFHGLDITAHPRQRGRGIYALLFARGSLFLPVSGRWNEELVALGCPRARIRVHRMGVDCRRFRPAAEASRPPGPLRLLSVARLAPKKGLEYALAALAHLRRSGRQVVLAIAGEGPERARLEAAARGLGVSDQVTWLGPLDHDALPSVLANADVFLAPSLTLPDGGGEGIPVAIMEAMAAGLPVVATRHSAIPELVADGSTGFLVDERDAAALAECLLRLEADPSLRRAFGAAGRARIEQEFEIERLNDTLAELYGFS